MTATTNGGSLRGTQQIAGPVSPPELTFTVIIPTLNEAATITQTIEHVCALEPLVELIVADGGSQDNTVSLAKAAGAIVVPSARGRGLQLNAGAAQATGDVLIFLHADTHLPPNAFSLLRRRFRDSQTKVGTFRLSFDKDHWLFRVYTLFSRFDSVLTSFGDQGIVIRRSFFEEIGRFPDWPLFEDVRLLQKARSREQVHSFPAAIYTSARRFQHEGIIRQSLRNGWYVFLYLCGVSPQKLAVKYEQSRRK